MTKPLEIAITFQSHEEVFLARYARLRVSALQITGNNKERAEDLLQDAYIHFTQARPDLARVLNLDAYLYSILRNLNISHVRRQARLQGRSLSIVEYDSAEIGLRSTDPRDLIRVHDELRACCHYACIRKESSKSGSVLLLRFMHGYYPREISMVMQCTREAVEERLRNARIEARQYLKDPTSLRFIREGGMKPDGHYHAAIALNTDDLLLELRNTILASCRGPCFSEAALDRFYDNKTAAGMDTVSLAHAISCSRCLDEINRRLGLPLLRERYSTDTFETPGSSTQKTCRARGAGDSEVHLQERIDSTVGRSAGFE